ncbi:YhgE/Pip domain-containing protein [Paenibacillus sp. strain BS8-2]
MKVLSNKLLVASPLIAMLVLSIFMLTLYPSATMKPVEMPVAIVNLDEGAKLPDGTEMKLGETMVEQMKGASGGSAGAEASPVKWVALSSEELAMEGLDNSDYYAAMIIPADFSAKQLSLRSAEPIQPELKVLINQGKNATAANMITQMVNGMVATMNGTISTELLQGLEASGTMLKPSQAALIAMPIKAQMTNVNETGASAARANAPISLFQPIWMASIAGAAIGAIAFAQSGSTIRSVSGRVVGRLLQTGIGLVLALLAGYLAAWLADGFLDLDVPNIGEMGLFMAIAIFVFYLMISAVLSWTGIKGIVMFVLLLFFGAPLLSMPPEFMNGFYRDWVHVWLPMRFLVEGLRELFFYGNGLQWTGSVAALVWIGLGSLVVLLLSAIRQPQTSHDSYKTSSVQ